MKILVTGAAGFIGYHLCERLLKEGHQVVGIDTINDYYDPQLKFDRLKELGIKPEEATIWKKQCQSNLYSEFKFIRLEIQDRNEVPKLFKLHGFDLVCNLAAQAGVRYSIENPETYVDTNITGFLNILEACRHYGVRRLVYASSSSVYGNSEEVPFKESQSVDKPISIYAATKKSNELMAHTYTHLFGIETIGLRFFTVYGPWGRPDMAMFLFTDAILKGKPIKVFNNGNLSRDFTYISDIIAGVSSVINNEYNKRSVIFNMGNSRPVQLMSFIAALEEQLVMRAQKVMMPMQDGDVNQTWADVSALHDEFGYAPKVSVNKGISAFVDWYKYYYKV
ncbi:NAD-dependent epimerase/dehydratase family protein [Dokdonia sp. Hel_I_53]|uniref:NAD-dependent epimerase/dehydratase family protein n=1 Tax=Dokdonia sp. Hel_I_53 TaxID=1566287 RepID=UPI001199C543|nr:NAD-dependent epimerase/dehydratase family protein [Dokdonia sp. Hel_I_53]TVZ51333.1 UDP-glucuronate 4-epimerase [Dokdonia sp. Hel_I_53]